MLLLNPRGSDGYGEDFFEAVLEGWGVADAKDFLEPLDRLVEEGIADPDRLAVTGYSYGGYMTCYLTSRDDRFAAAVAGGVVTDLVSMAGTGDLGHLLGTLELGGPPWEARDRYEAMSPLARVEHVSTPTLVYHGAADLRCPVGQAQQWYAALRGRRRPDPARPLPGGVPPVRARRAAVAPDRLQQADHGLGGAARSGRRRPTPSTPTTGRQRLGRAGRRSTRCPARRWASSASDADGEDEVVAAAHGLLNKETGVETTSDSVFQIGSMTKVWTATVVMQLVDEGKLDLDAPIVDVLPELRLADADVTQQVTMRHLLSHTSGIDGDIFTDTGRGDDCLEKYVAPG